MRDLHQLAQAARGGLETNEAASDRLHVAAMVVVAEIRGLSDALARYGAIQDQVVHAVFEEYPDGARGLAREWDEVVDASEYTSASIGDLLDRYRESLSVLSGTFLRHADLLDDLMDAHEELGGCGVCSEFLSTYSTKFRGPGI